MFYKSVGSLLVLLTCGTTIGAESSWFTSPPTSDVVRDIYQLQERFVENQYFFLPIAPPAYDVFLQPNDTVVPVDWGGFPPEFTKLMYADMDANGYPLYGITIYEDPATRETVFMNSYGTEIYRLQAEKNYNPYAWQAEYFNLDSGTWLSEFYRWIYDPAHIAASFSLIPDSFYEDYVEIQQEQTLLEEAAASMEMMMSLPELVTNILLAINSITNGAIELEVGWPTNFTDRLELYATTNLIAGPWILIWTNIVTTNSSSYIWTNSISTNTPVRFYAAGNADQDTDGDSLLDAREYFLYHTNPMTNDTDGDFMYDDWELAHSLNPNDDLDMILDPDHDMLPNVYEHYYGLNPNSNDSAYVTKLRVDSALAGETNTYASIQEAFNASTNYSIIEIAAGNYSITNSGLSFPAHPIMLMSDDWGTNRNVEIQFADQFAFFMSDGQDNRTIIRGLNLKQTGRGDMQIGFYIGNGFLPFQGAAPYFDGVHVELGSSEWAVGFYGLGWSEGTDRPNNCVVRGNGNHNVQSGICLIDAPDVQVANCSFLNFNSSTNESHGILLGTYSGTSVVEARIDNCFWDSSFTSSNSNYAVAHTLGSSARYHTSVAWSIVPDLSSLVLVDSAPTVLVTNATALPDGMILSNSPCINASGTTPLSWYDFHGQPRDAMPDVGADEYCVFTTNDFDGDGLTDYAEAYIHGSSIMDTDTDNDGVDDGYEAVRGTDPTDGLHYCVSLQGSVTNLSTLTGTVYAAAVLMEQAQTPTPWELVQGAVAKTNLQRVVVTNGTFLLNHVTVDQRSTNENWYLWLEVYQDTTANEALDYFDPKQQVKVSVTNHTLNFELELPMPDDDLDADKIPDWWEFSHGLSGINEADAFADPDGDWIDNMWEYRLDLDPNVYNTNNYAFADAMQAVDSRLAGKDPGTSIEILSTYDNSTPEYVRNTNCWATNIDLTCCSPWNSEKIKIGAGTLVSPRHALFVNHHESFVVPAGSTLRFIDATNGLYIATIESVHHVSGISADLTVAVLSNNIPTNRLSIAQILPENYSNYLGHADIHVPGLCLDQEEKALVHDLRNNLHVKNTSSCSFEIPVYGARTNFYDLNEGVTGPAGLRLTPIFGPPA